jgi:Trypsin-co-occurring domain 1
VPEDAPGGIPGVDDASWRHGDPGPSGARPTLVQMGEDAVREATEALAEQIDATARRIADAIGKQEQEQEQAKPGTFGLDSVEVAFGVTLTGGVQTLFTLQADSSVQVTITLSRNR